VPPLGSEAIAEAATPNGHEQPPAAAYGQAPPQPAPNAARAVPPAGGAVSAPPWGTAGAEAGVLAADPDELAAIVNEALVEQARRHGVDLS